MVMLSPEQKAIIESISAVDLRRLAKEKAADEKLIKAAERHLTKQEKKPRAARKSPEMRAMEAAQKSAEKAAAKEAAKMAKAAAKEAKMAAKKAEKEAKSAAKKAAKEAKAAEKAAKEAAEKQAS